MTGQELTEVIDALRDCRSSLLAMAVLIPAPVVKADLFRTARRATLAIRILRKEIQCKTSN